MATPNRASLINQHAQGRQEALQAGARRRRTARCWSICCSPAAWRTRRYDAAEQVFKTLKDDYFDWNEVRVSTIRELAEVTKPLNDPADAATRLKQMLQSVFERDYSFDLEPLKKQNIGAGGQAAGKVQRQHAVRRRLRHADGAGRAFDSGESRPA